MSKPIKLYTLNVCSFLYMLYFIEAVKNDSNVHVTRQNKKVSYLSVINRSTSMKNSLIIINQHTMYSMKIKFFIQLLNIFPLI